MLRHQKKRKQEDILVAHVVSQEELLLKKQNNTHTKHNHFYKQYVIIKGVYEWAKRGFQARNSETEYTTEANMSSASAGCKMLTWPVSSEMGNYSHHAHIHHTVSCS